MAESPWDALLGAAVAEVAPTSALRVASLVAPSSPPLLDPYLDAGALGRRVEISREGTTRLGRTSRRPYHDVCVLSGGEPLRSAGILEGTLDLALVDAAGAPWLGEVLRALTPGGVLLTVDGPEARAGLGGRGKSPARSRGPSSPRSDPPKPAGEPGTAASRRSREGRRLRRESPRDAEVSSVEVGGVSLLIVRGDPPATARAQAPWSTLDRCACVDRGRVAAALALGASAGIREVPEWARLRRRLAAAVDGRAEDPALGAALLGDARTLVRGAAPTGEPGPAVAETGVERRVDLLLLVPHPDDETVYFGGVVAAACRAGLRLHVATLTGGEGGLDLRGDRGVASGGGASAGPAREGERGLAETRAQEQAQALEALGAGGCPRQGLGFADTGKYLDRRRALPMSAAEALARWGPEALVDRLIQLFRAVRPRAVVTMDPIHDPNYSLHAHHLGCGAAALVAAGLAENGKDPTSAIVSLWTVQPPHVGAEGTALVGAEIPQVVPIPVDIGRKIAALAAYPSQGYSTQRLIASLERAQAAGEGVYEVLLQRARLSPGADPIQLLLGADRRSA